MEYVTRSDGLNGPPHLFASICSVMCGRFTNRYTWKQLHKLLQLTTPPIELKERYNIAPTQFTPIVRMGRVEGGAGNGRRLDMLRWGLIPPWARDESFGNKAINARAETVATSGAFRDSFRRRRCLVPASGFYEWKKVDSGGNRKQPYYITSSDGEPMMLAGLWSCWKNSPDKTLETFTIVTTSPNELMATLHNRMPVIVREQDWGLWLDSDAGDGDPNVDVASRDAASLLRPYPAELMMAYPVATKVNSPKNDGPELIQPMQPQELPPIDEPGLFF